MVYGAEQFIVAPAVLQPTYGMSTLLASPNLPTGILVLAVYELNEAGY
jgi:hypothetical protein